MNETITKKILSDDVKLVLATVSIVCAVLGSFYTLQNQVSVISQKIDTALATINRQQDSIQQITQDDSGRDSRLASIEAIIRYKPI